MLPPDNFQEEPTPAIAHRTSPTNIGLYLLSVASARDFGWIGATQAIERLEATLATMNRLQRFRGHFYNWYDTRDLRVLDPKYVSSVDSGNLAGHLIALANACREWRLSPSSAASLRAGLADTLALAAEEAVRLRAGRRTQTVTPLQLEDSLATMSKILASAVGDEETTAADWAQLAHDGEILIDIASAIALERSDGAAADLLYWSQATLTAIAAHRSEIASSADAVATRSERLIVLEDAFRAMAMAMEYGFLFDKERQLLSIGYLISESALDPNCYDLLASEARLASFFAIAKGDIPARHWFRLGRAATAVSRGSALISWSGSMFEYLMPPLVMRAPAGSLLEQTDRLVVRRQIEYGAKLGLPWGVSESAYNARDLDFTYQYSNFGIPGLGLKRGLGENRVVAPVCDGSGGHGRPFGCRRKSEATDGDGRAGSLRILRGGRLYADARSGGRELRARSLVHGAPPGHDYRRDRQRIVRRRDARALSCRTDHSGDGIVVAGARSARGRLDATLGRRGKVGPPRQRGRSLRRAQDRLSASLHPLDVAALQRPLRRDVDGRGLRLQPLGRYSDNAMAGGRDARRQRLLYLSARHAQRRPLVGRLSADRRGARRVFCALQRGPRRVHAARRRADDDARRARLGRRRRRSASRDNHERRGSSPRNRNHVLRRVEPGAAERGCRASRLRETLRRNRISPRSRRDPGDAAQADAHRARNLGRASERRQRRVRRQAGIRDRPGALARSRAWRQRADRDVGRAAFDQFDRSGARPDLRVAPSRQSGARGDGSRRFLDNGGGHSRGAARSHRQTSRFGGL